MNITLPTYYHFRTTRTDTTIVLRNEGSVSKMGQPEVTGCKDIGSRCFAAREEQVCGQHRYLGTWPFQEGLTMIRYEVVS